MGAPGRSQREIALFCEDGKPFAPVSRIDLAADHAVALETGNEMSRTGRAEQHSIGEGCHAEPLVGRVEQSYQHVELSDPQTVVAAQLGVEALQNRTVQHHQRAPRLPLVRVEELVLPGS